MQIYSDKIFKNPQKIISAFDSESFIFAFQEIEKLKNKCYLIGYVRYEAKDVFLGKNIKSKYPLLYFEAYENFEKFSPNERPQKVFLFRNQKFLLLSIKKVLKK